ncbi:hypothetical protein [Henriciella marina]|uniref:hypothetical protein n=1 Tax=Henriciella marina TaxID=453851 RepID=UPI0012EA2839|nr:hypothetical protein [Henriciella marina]
MTLSRFLSATLVAATAAIAPAMADTVHLTSAEMTQAEDACRAGSPLIPVRSDFGNETGEFALPVMSENGKANSAIILDENAIDALPGCKARIEQADFLPQRPQPNRAIS